MSSIYEGRVLRLSIFGQSHSAAIGCVLDGLPSGIAVDPERIAAFMARRAPGRDEYSTKRSEADAVEILSGVAGGLTCGAPLSVVIRNTDTRSGDYAGLSVTPRPSHADFTARVKYGKAADFAGGGHFSGRLTAPLCAAGAILLGWLEDRGVSVGAHIARIAGVSDAPFDAAAVGAAEMSAVAAKRFPVIDDAAGARMREAIEAARLESDSVGGVIECAAAGLPAGLGDPMFGGVENRISQCGICGGGYARQPSQRSVRYIGWQCTDCEKRSRRGTRRDHLRDAARIPCGDKAHAVDRHGAADC